MSRLLFNVGTKSNRQLDKEQLERTRNRRKGGPVVTVLPANATLKQRLEYASAKSEQLLGSKKDQVELVTDIHRFDKFINKCIENGILSVDTETDGLDRIDGVLAGVCLYTPGEKGIYVPINHISAMTHELLDGQMSKDIVKGGFEKLNDADVKYILHNAKFDMHTIYWGTGAKIIPYWDTLIGANLLNENEPHGLKYLWHKYCSKEEETAELAKFNTLFDKIPFTMVKPEVAYLYAGFDPIMTFELYEFQSHFLTEDDPVCIEHGLTRVAQVFHNIEMPVLPAVWDMEATGVEIDSELSAQLHDKYNGYLDESEEILTKALDGLGSEIAAFSASHPDKAAKLERPINVTSPVQLQILLYDILGLESTDSKKPRGTGEEIIEGIHDKLNNATSKTRLPSVVKAHLEDIKTILGCILDIRGMKKYLSTYIDKLPEACSKRTGRLHCSYNQYGAKTGRFSSSDPNLQNIPSKSKKLMNGTVIDAGHDIRQLFKAPEGYVFIGGDYSQQEPRCLAFMSQDAQMLDAYKHGKDLYATIASFVYNMPYEECLEFRPDGSVNKEGKQRRSSVKPVLLGIMYGRGTASIAEQMHLTVKEAENIIKTFFEMFPAVADFVYSTQLKAGQTGYVETAAGRKRRLPDMMLDEYEFKLIDESKVQSFNPLFDDEDFTDSDEDELEELAQKYTAKLSRARSYKQVQRIKEEAKEDNCQIIDNRGKLADAERKCVNSIIQGSSADITKTSLIELYNDEELKKLGYRTVLTIHDENIGMCPIENVKACSERFREIMLNAARNIIDVPMSVDVEITKRWYGEDYSHKIEELS